MFSCCGTVDDVGVAPNGGLLTANAESTLIQGGVFYDDITLLLLLGLVLFRLFT